MSELAKRYCVIWKNLNITKQTRLKECKQKTVNGWKELFKDIVAIYRQGSYLLEGQVKVISLTNKTRWAEKSQVFFKEKKKKKRKAS